VVELAHKEFAGQTTAPPIAHPALPQYWKIDNSKSKTDLGIKYRPKEETQRASISDLISLKKNGKLH